METIDTTNTETKLFRNYCVTASKLFRNYCVTNYLSGKIVGEIKGTNWVKIMEILTKKITGYLKTYDCFIVPHFKTKVNIWELEPSNDEDDYYDGEDE